MASHILTRRWLTGCTLGEALGIAAVALVYALIDRGHLAPPAPFILAAGGWEGLCLGTAQALVLRRLGARAGLWVALTVAAAVAGYGLSILGGAGSGDGGAAAEPPFWLILAAGAGAGLGMGLVMGLAQAPALPRTVRAGRWVVANAMGWALAMAAIMAGAGLVASGWPLGMVVAVGAASGALAGLAVGLVTLTVLRPALPSERKDLSP